MVEQQVLCIPRQHICDQEWFTPWESAGWFFRAAESGMLWMPRREAEVSDEFVQPIPCTLVLGADTGYHVFRRIKDGRADLRARLSLVVGGHIDWEQDTAPFKHLIATTLAREIDEELAADWTPPPKPIGLVVDHTSIDSSRHIGVLHEVLVTGSVQPLAREEFSARSAYAGKLCDIAELLAERDGFDPWSAIIFHEYIAPTHRFDVGWQRRMI